MLAVGSEKKQKFFFKRKENSSEEERRNPPPVPAFLVSNVHEKLIQHLKKMFETDELLREVEQQLALPKIEKNAEEYIELLPGDAVLFWYMVQFTNPYEHEIGQKLFNISPSNFNQKALFQESEKVLKKYFPFIEDGTVLTLHLFWLIINGSYFAFTPTAVSDYDKNIYISAKSSFFISLFENLAEKTPEKKETFKKIFNNQIAFFPSRSETQTPACYISMDKQIFITRYLDLTIRECLTIWEHTRDTIHMGSDQ
jgi:hypothetical protein